MSRGLYSRRVLGAHKPTLRRTLYTVFNLETHAFSTASHKKKKRSPLMQGIYLQDVRGLNFHMVLERLALLHYGKQKSMSYADQVEEYTMERHNFQLKFTPPGVHNGMESAGVDMLHILYLNIFKMAFNYTIHQNLPVSKKKLVRSYLKAAGFYSYDAAAAEEETAGARRRRRGLRAAGCSAGRQGIAPAHPLQTLRPRHRRRHSAR